MRLLVGPARDPMDVDTEAELTNEQRNYTAGATAADKEILPRTRSQVWTVRYHCSHVACRLATELWEEMYVPYPEPDWRLWREYLSENDN